MSGSEFDGSWLRDSLPEIEMARQMWNASPDGQAHAAEVRERIGTLPDATITVSFGPNPMRAAVENHVAEHGQPTDPLVHIGEAPIFTRHADGTVTMDGSPPEHVEVSLDLLALPDVDELALSFTDGLLVMGRPPCVRYRPLWIDHASDVVVCRREER